LSSSLTDFEPRDLAHLRGIITTNDCAHLPTIRFPHPTQATSRLSTDRCILAHVHSPQPSLQVRAINPYPSIFSGHRKDIIVHVLTS
jgi:predicted MPP superfamily phosphohydrolase